MQPLTSQLVSSLKELFASEEQSDFSIDIIETEEVNFHLTNDRSTRKRTCSEKHTINNDVLYCTLPVHSCILTLQSEYFKTMYECSMKESKSRKMTLKVGKGEGVYVKLFVQSFYDHDIFNEMDLYKYLRFVEIADRYIGSSVINQASSKIDHFTIKCLDDCEKVVQHIASTNYGLPGMKKLAESLISKCSTYAASVFCPLEIKLVSNEGRFKNLSFDLLLAILKSDAALAYTENSLLYFVLSWLDFDILRQRDDIIKELIETINYANLTPDYLLDVITEKHPLLSKWSQYGFWFLKAIAYHAHSRCRPCLIDYNDTESEDYSHIFYCKEKPLFFNIKFEKDISNNFRKVKDMPSFIYRGYEISPLLKFEDCGNLKKDIFLEFQVLNLREHNIPSDDDVFLRAKVLIGIDGNAGNRRVNDSTIFRKMASSNCFNSTIVFNLNSKKINLGHIANMCLENWNCFSLYISFIHTYDTWPSYIPSIIKGSQSNMNVRCCNN